MKPYDAQREYMRQYFGPKYPHVIAIRGHVPIDWMTANLTPTFTYSVDNDMGPDYQQTIIGYGIHGVRNRPDENLYLFHDKDHLEKVVAAFPDLVVTTDPFGPDLCPRCAGLSTPQTPPKPLPLVKGWRRGAARLLGIPIQ
ncbi:hypothetical protein [Sphingomonas hankookensis]|uniref:hypothetical protein n=1 Tax=Sphingomonas hankookensis TaxID=563996 RepID=UPI003D303654